MTVPEERASYRRCVQRSAQAWPGFLARRLELLTPVERYGHGAEKLAEDVVREFLTIPVGWTHAELIPRSVERTWSSPNLGSSGW